MHFPKHESSVVKTESQKYTGATYFKQDSSVMKNGTQKYTGATYSKQDSSEMKNEIPKYKGATYSKQDSSVIKNEVPKYTGASYFKQDSSVMKNETQKYTGATYSKQDSSEMKNEIPKYTGATYSKQDSSVMKNDTQKYTGATYPCSVIAPAKLYILKDENRVMPIDLESAKNVSNFPQNMVQYQNVQQYYGGRMTHQRLLEVRSATEAALVSLHKALQTCPALEEEELDPEGLKTKLKPHQKKGLKWLLWRENHVPRGGILADDMGLGKTLTMLALILKDIESNLQSVEDNGVINAKTTLVICPVSLIYQWENEAMKHCVMKAFPGDILLYHGQNREINSKRLATYSIVITSYNIIQREVGPPKVEADQKIKDIWGQPAAKSESSGNTSSPLLKIVWNRIILDEGHTIKNPKSNTALAVCRLRAKNRWVVTGTPIHNKLSDLYSLLRFLRYSPFDEHQVWKNWMESDTSTGRLNKLVKSILLIRNKNHIDENGIPIVELPTKSIEIHKLSLEGKEKEIYDKIQSYSKSALQCLLDKKEEVQNENTKLALSSNGPKRTLNAATLLALLTRMQQCCSHLSLLKPMLDGSPDPEPVDELDAILNQLSNLNIKDDAATTSNIYAGIDMSVYKNDKDFKIEASSLKIGTVLREVQNIRDSKKGDKCVIVSQWTSLLDIMGFHLKKGDIKYDVIQGNVKLEERNRVMQHFNKNPKGPMVVLLSLRAGGVGINLTGGNHLFLLDNHWNPALENQACDRIYRMGQTKEVKIHKFVCKDTIEERVMELQKQKLHLASKVLEGNADKNNQKLSLQDLKALFGMN